MDGIRVINYFEKFKVWWYGLDVILFYVLVDKGLGNFICIQMKREVVIVVFGERYQYLFFVVLVNGYKNVIVVFLGLLLIVCDGVDIIEGLNYKKDLRDY